MDPRLQRFPKFLLRKKRDKAIAIRPHNALEIQTVDLKPFLIFFFNTFWKLVSITFER